MKKVRLIRILLPPIRVHVWGGFGSQLFALIVAWRISERFKYRRIRLVFHTSGVTERVRELPRHWLTDFLIQEVRDFKHLKQGAPDFQTYRSKKMFVNLIPELLVRSGFLNRANSNQDFKVLKPWVYEIRGHYSGFLLKDSEIAKLANLIHLESEVPATHQVSIHYRLGDLLSLASKTYIEPTRVNCILADICERHVPTVIFSDSNGRDLSEVLGSVFQNRAVSFAQLSPIDTIRYCVNSSFFVGTNSKISLWITIFRSRHGQLSAIPKELGDHLNHELDLPNSNHNVLIY